ncbi:hypothetical protein OR16_40924 [Cupriavidus basilensis OR16]|uniref:DUF5666 domain-containing protein n=1 Tax=Cupriavidus basilensis OR16 TaxID=1127483 RepID=H1SI70_9BURK|nr:hypothetical protein [Cupriavidus basilensis]EHP37771.1 hypothetical protein OR16_40924 [Cupriavidus basilensis OR16]
MRRILPLIAALSVVLAACVHAVPAGRSIALTGTVMVKGSALFQQPMLVTADGEAWVLEKFPVDAAEALRGKKVGVTGTVLRANQPGTWAPAIRVERIEAMPDGEPAR